MDRRRDGAGGERELGKRWRGKNVGWRWGEKREREEEGRDSEDGKKRDDKIETEEN